MTQNEVHEIYREGIREEIQEYARDFYSLPTEAIEAKLAEYIDGPFTDDLKWHKDCEEHYGATMPQLLHEAREAAQLLCSFRRRARNAHNKYMQKMADLDNEMVNAYFDHQAEYMVEEKTYHHPHN